MVVTAAGIGLLLCSAFIGYEKKISRCQALGRMLPSACAPVRPGPIIAI